MGGIELLAILGACGGIDTVAVAELGIAEIVPGKLPG